MLSVTIPSEEFFNERTGEFVMVDGKTIQMEHSLISVSKWEAKWKTPFFTDKQKTIPQIVDYYRCMTVTPNVNPMIFRMIRGENEKKIWDYINDSQTATTIKRSGAKKGHEILTSELIYYYMTALNIPFECEKWHMSRLLTLIEVASIKSQPSKKMGKKDIYNQNRALNAARRAKSGNRG